MAGYRSRCVRRLGKSLSFRQQAHRTVTNLFTLRGAQLISEQHLCISLLLIYINIDVCNNSRVINQFYPKLDPMKVSNN